MISITITRLIRDKFFSLGILISVLIASIVVAGGFMYQNSFHRITVKNSLDEIGTYNKNIRIDSQWIPLEYKEIQKTNLLIEELTDNNIIDEIKYDSTYHLRTKEHFWNKNDDKVISGDLVSRLFFHTSNNLMENIEIIEGNYPKNEITYDNDINTLEVIIYKNRSKNIRHDYQLKNLEINDIISAQSVPRKIGLVRAKIVGVFDIKDPYSEFWNGDPSLLLDPDPPMIFGGRERPIVLFTNFEAFTQGLESSNSGLPVDYQKIFHIDTSKILSLSTNDILKNLRDFQNEVFTKIPRSNVYISIIPTIERVENKILFLKLPMYIIGSFAITFVLFYVFLISKIINNKRSVEIAVLLSRGLSFRQLFNISIFESFFIVFIPGLLGTFIAFYLLQITSDFKFFNPITNGNDLYINLNLRVYFYVFIMNIIILFVLLIPLFEKLFSKISINISTQIFSDSRNFFHKFFIDYLLILLFGVFIWQLVNRGIVYSDIDNNLYIDIVILLAPVMFLLGVILIILRVFPLIVNILHFLIYSVSSVGVFIAIVRLKRNFNWYSLSLLLTVFTISLSVIIGSLTSTLDRSSREKVLYDIPSDLRLIIREPINQNDIYELSNIDGIIFVSSAFREEGIIGTTQQGPSFTLLGLDTKNIEEFIWYREDFSQINKSKLFDKIRKLPDPPPINIPLEATHLSASSMQEPYVKDHFFWIILEDSEKRKVTVTLGQIESNWTNKVAKIPSHLKHPIEIVSIQTFMPVSGDSGTPTDWYVDNVRAIGPSLDKVLIDFEEDNYWSPLPTSNGLDDTIEIISDVQKENQFAKISLDVGTIVGVRGIYRNSNGKPIPIAVSKSYLNLTENLIGDYAVVQVYGGFVPVEIVAIVDNFPTLDPIDYPFIILDVNSLLSFLEFRGMVNVSENEFFIDVDEFRKNEIKDQINNLFMSSTIKDADENLKQTLVDPTTILGWKVTSYLSILLSIIILVLSFYSYFFAFYTNNRKDAFILKSIGISRRTFILSLFLENLLLVIFGLFIGIISGYYSAKLSISGINYFYDGKLPLPPVVFEWNFIPLIIFLFFILIINISSIYFIFKKFVYDKVELIR